MAILKPFLDDDDKVIDYADMIPAPENSLDKLESDAKKREQLNSGAAEILEDLGVKEAVVVKEVTKLTKEDEKLRARDIFHKAGASLENIAKKTAYLMQHGEDGPMFNAIKLASTVHGILTEIDDGPKAPTININIVSQTGEQKTILNLVVPRG